MKRTGLITLGLLVASPYLLKSWYQKWDTMDGEATEKLPGDDIVSNPKVYYTTAVTIDAQPSDIWPWVVQLGRGQSGFYTYEWVESLLESDKNLVNEIIPRFQRLKVGDKIWLPPNPNLNSLQGQYLVVDQLEAPWTLVFRQILPDEAAESWAFVLRMRDDTTRLIFRRRSSRPALIDRITEPGFFIMDRGMLRGIRRRVESNKVTVE